ncbi:hypothetical protein HXX76_003074 [Chlamydomonas incerta]|uniref:Uncharacterized protein n=1 Tax=Chlamydomonas incerta TaxID=51695 RepID=A0A835TD28_CHLIN|nr:hypothetical protein HXX76_003074 [Chlamydomonas incerta]|eukprot:KAG2441452.1 hypothetical protein HXX76_003074 [Chlamydomonas incerta]
MTEDESQTEPSTAGEQDLARVLSKIFRARLRQTVAERPPDVAGADAGRLQNVFDLTTKQPLPYTHLALEDEEELAGLRLQAEQQQADDDGAPQQEEEGADVEAPGAGAFVTLQLTLAPALWQTEEAAELAQRMGLDRRQPPGFSLALPARTQVALLRRLLARRLGLYPSFLQLSRPADEVAEQQQGPQGQEPEPGEAQQQGRGAGGRAAPPGRRRHPRRLLLLDAVPAPHNPLVALRQTLAACGLLRRAGCPVFLALQVEGDPLEAVRHADPHGPRRLALALPAAAAAAPAGHDRRKRLAPPPPPPAVASPPPPPKARVRRLGPPPPPPASQAAVEAAVVGVLAGRGGTGGGGGLVLTSAHVTALVAQRLGVEASEELRRAVRGLLTLHSYPCAPPGQAQQGQGQLVALPQLQQRLQATSELCAEELRLLVAALRAHGADWARIARCPCFRGRRSKEALFRMWAHVVSAVYGLPGGSSSGGGSSAGELGALAVLQMLEDDLDLLRQVQDTWAWLKGLPESPEDY